MDPDRLREKLDSWALTNERPSISCLPKNCACEQASAPPGGHGPVRDTELLAYFVTSRYNIDLKRRRNFTPKKLKNVFEKGLSSVRLDLCSLEELNKTCEVIARPLVEQDGEFGGIVEIVIARCSKIRYIKCNMTDGDRIFCVYETPSGRGDDGQFERPSHADILASCKIDDRELQQLILPELFNAMRQDQKAVSIFEFFDGIFSGFAPKALSEP